ncbi:MAG TPA: c-type cytochrome [Candidatus Sulfopaludibacter sp.]|nr:c-type cytochrome [Candidatus Sulfopaludibacter sp.]
MRGASLLFLALLAAIVLLAQAPQTPPAGGAAQGGRGRGGGGGFGSAFPQHATEDPAKVERGKALYGVNCNFCHGSDARGGEGGPNLLRSDLVLNDQHGELIGQVVQKGKGEMPALNLTAEQVSEIAAFIHSMRVSGYDASRMAPPSILVGDAGAGEAVFKTKCASCHSATGDLKGIAAKITDPKILQNTFLMPGGGGRGGRGGMALPVPPTTVTVISASGAKAEGRLVRIDDFMVNLVDSDGVQRTIRRDGDVPKVEIHDPLKPHRDMLPTYTDKDIHNLTSYLVTLK